MSTLVIVARPIDPEQSIVAPNNLRVVTTGAVGPRGAAGQAADPEVVESAVEAYLTANPPEAGVTSVNGMNGAVELEPGDIGAATTASVTAGDAATLTAANAYTDAAVTETVAGVSSVNGEDGAVVLTAADVGAATAAQGALAATAVQPAAIASAARVYGVVGDTYVQATGDIYVGTLNPNSAGPTPTDGDQWWNPDTGVVRVRWGPAWVPFGGEGGGAGLVETSPGSGFFVLVGE